MQLIVKLIWPLLVETEDCSVDLATKPILLVATMFY